MAQRRQRHLACSGDGCTQGSLGQGSNAHQRGKRTCYTMTMHLPITRWKPCCPHTFPSIKGARALAISQGFNRAFEATFSQTKHKIDGTISIWLKNIFPLEYPQKVSVGFSWSCFVPTHCQLWLLIKVHDHHVCCFLPGKQKTLQEGTKGKPYKHKTVVSTVIFSCCLLLIVRGVQTIT